MLLFFEISLRKWYLIACIVMFLGYKDLEMKRRHLELKKIKNQGNFSSKEEPTAIGQAWMKKKRKRKNVESSTASTTAVF